MTGQSFSANSDEVIAGIRAVNDLHQFWQSATANFKARTADTSWTGEDSFGDQLKPKVKQVVTAVGQTADAVGEGLDGIGGGTLSNLHTILAAQGSAIQAIDQHGSGTRT